MLLLFAQVMGQRGNAHSSYPRALALTLSLSQGKGERRLAAVAYRLPSLHTLLIYSNFHTHMCQ